MEKRLKKLGLDFELIYVDEDLLAREEMESITGGTIVPVLLNQSNGKIMIGCPYDEQEFIDEIKRLLGVLKHYRN